MTVSSNGEKPAIGRFNVLDDDENYQPVKYKNYTRFNFSTLVDAKTSKKYPLVDGCALHFLLPN